jgi:hypothetical protein
VRTKENGWGAWNKTHGLSRSPEYGAWNRMHNRCYNPRSPRYPDWGGRGITVCNSWKNFEAFYRDIGPRPSSAHSLDRINTNGNYEPGNVRWATQKEQQNNKRNTVRYMWNGKQLTLSQIHQESKVPIGWGTFWKRVRKHNWPIEGALAPPYVGRRAPTRRISNG